MDSGGGSWIVSKHQMGKMLRHSPPILVTSLLVAVAATAATSSLTDAPLAASALVFAVAIGTVAATTMLICAREIEQSEREDFDALVRNSSDVITVIGPDGAIRYQSPSVERIFGHDPAGLIGTALAEWLHPEDWPHAFAVVAEAAARPSGRWLIECRWRHADGSWRDTEITLANLLDDPKIERLVLNTRDVTERKELEKELTKQAHEDPLTKVANRALFRDRMERALARASRRAERLAVLLLDLDGFKEVNDEFGHRGGDEVLVEIAERLVDCVREVDTVGRWGGDEFVILLEGTNDREAASIVAERIAAALKVPCMVAGREVTIKASLGISMSDRGGTVDDLLRQADLAMYAAKRKLQGGYGFFDEETELDPLQ